MKIERKTVKEAGPCSMCDMKKKNVWEVKKHQGSINKVNFCNHCLRNLKAMYCLYYGEEC